MDTTDKFEIKNYKSKEPIPELYFTFLVSRAKIPTGYCSLIVTQGNHKDFPFPDIYDLNIKIDFPLLDQLDSENTIFQVKIDTDFDKVLKIDEIIALNQPMSNALVRANKHRNVEHNKNILSKLQNKKILSTLIEYPSIPENIFIEKKKWEILISALRFGQTPCLSGPKGVGKTTIVKAIAKAMGCNYYRISCGTLVKPKATLVGQLHLENGNTVIKKSKFLKHYTAEVPTIIFVDEITRTPGQAVNYIMNILDENESFIYVEELGEDIFKSPHVMFFAAGNFGIQYSDTRNLDDALVDRLVKQMIGYLSPEQELKLVKQKLELVNTNNKVPDSAIMSIIDKANELRHSFKEGALTIDISQRKVIQICHYLLDGFSPYEVMSLLLRPLFINDNEGDLEHFDKTLDAVN
jgi:nitric oxide reductase NorQ protein